MSGRALDSEAIPARVLQEAAHWFASLADGHGEEERRRWLAWMAEHPDHARAWKRVEAVTGQLMPLSATGDAVRNAMDAPRRSDRRNVLRGLGGLVVIGGASWMASQLPWRTWREEVAQRRAEYRTERGTVLALALPDGSHIWLGSLSVLDYDYDADLRRLHLHQGDLLVETALDRRLPQRPFVVDTPHGRLRALGTRFAVRSSPDRSRVDVFEGAVELTPAESNRPIHLVHAGEHAVFHERALETVGRASPGREAWSRNILAADRLRLDELADELTRWHDIPIVCDPQVGGLELVGAYPLKDLDRILGALTTSLPVRIVRDEHRIRIVADAGRKVGSDTQGYDTPPRRIPRATELSGR